MSPSLSTKTNQAGKYTVLKEQTAKIKSEENLEHERRLNLLKQFISELKKIGKA